MGGDGLRIPTLDISIEMYTITPIRNYLEVLTTLASLSSAIRGDKSIGRGLSGRYDDGADNATSSGTEFRNSEKGRTDEFPATSCLAPGLFRILSIR